MHLVGKCLFFLGLGLEYILIRGVSCQLDRWFRNQDDASTVDEKMLSTCLDVHDLNVLPEYIFGASVRLRLLISMLFFRERCFGMV